MISRQDLSILGWTLIVCIAASGAPTEAKAEAPAANTAADAGSGAAPPSCESAAESATMTCNLGIESASAKGVLESMRAKAKKFAAEAGDAINKSCNMASTAAEEGKAANSEAATACNTQIGNCTKVCEEERATAETAQDFAKAELAQKNIVACQTLTAKAASYAAQASSFGKNLLAIGSCVAQSGILEKLTEGKAEEGGKGAGSTATNEPASSAPSYSVNNPRSAAGYKNAGSGSANNQGQLSASDDASAFSATALGKGAANGSSADSSAYYKPGAGNASLGASGGGGGGGGYSASAAGGGLQLSAQNSQNQPSTNRVGGMAKRLPTGSFGADGGGGGGGFGGYGSARVQARMPAPFPSFAVQRQAEDKPPVTRAPAEAAYCATRAVSDALHLCQDPRQALCGDTLPPAPSEQQLAEFWEQIHRARQSFFDNNIIALKQVLGDAGPADSDARNYSPAAKKEYVQRYAVQAAIDMEKVVTHAQPAPPDANILMLRLYRFAAWAPVAMKLGSAAEQQKAIEDARATLMHAIYTSELAPQDKAAAANRLAKVGLLTQNSVMHEQPSANDDGTARISDFTDICGLAPRFGKSDAIFWRDRNALVFCPTLGAAGVDYPNTFATAAHELAHAIDSVGMRDSHVYSRYVSCLRDRPGSPLAMAHSNDAALETEAIADLWMSRTIAISKEPLFMSAESQSTTRFLRQVMSGLCRRDQDSPQSGQQRSPSSMDFRLREVFGRDAWVRWQTGCANICKSEKICTLRGTALDGEERPK